MVAINESLKCISWDIMGGTTTKRVPVKHRQLMVLQFCRIITDFRHARMIKNFYVYFDTRFSKSWVNIYMCYRKDNIQF